MPTGLPDRKGNEAYEDDILQDVELKDQLYRIHNNREEGRFQLICISPDKYAGWTEAFNKNTLLEKRIVGNIHSKKGLAVH